MKNLLSLVLSLPLFLLSSCVFYEEPGTAPYLPDLEWTYGMDIHNVAVANDTIYTVAGDLKIDNFSLENCTIGNEDEPIEIHNVNCFDMNNAPGIFFAESDTLVIETSEGEYMFYVVPWVSFPNFPSWPKSAGGDPIRVKVVASAEELPGVPATYRHSFTRTVKHERLHDRIK